MNINKSIERIAGWSLEEVNSFWSKLHSKNEMSATDFENNELALVGLYHTASVTRDNQALGVLLIAVINNFDVDKANDTIQKINSNTEIAEQLHYYFLDKPEQLKGFLATMQTIYVKFEAKSKPRSRVKDILNSIKGE